MAGTTKSVSGWKHLLSRKPDQKTGRVELTEKDFNGVTADNPLKFVTYPRATSSIRIPATRVCPSAELSPPRCEYPGWKYNQVKTDERAPNACPECGLLLDKRREEPHYLPVKNWIVTARTPWEARMCYNKGLSTIFDRNMAEHGALWKDVLNDFYRRFTRGGRRNHPYIRDVEYL